MPALGQWVARLNFQPCFSWADVRGKGLDFKSDPFNLGRISNLTKLSGACAAVNAQEDWPKIWPVFAR